MRALFGAGARRDANINWRWDGAKPLVVRAFRWGALPIVFAGNPATLKRTRANAHGIDQVLSRIGNSHRPLIVKLTAGDISAFCVEFDVELAAHETLRRFATRRNCRALIAVLEEARDLAGRGPIRDAELRQALAALHGPEAVKVVPPAKPDKQQQERKIA